MSLHTSKVGGGFAIGIPGLRRPLLLDREGEAGGSGAPAANPPASPSPALTAADVQRLAGPLLEQVRTQVQEAINPIQAQQTAINQRIEQLSQPRTNASQLFGGGAPGVRTGEDPLTSRGYQLYRVMGLRQNILSQDQAKVEYALHERLLKLYQTQGFIREARDSLLVPFGSEYVAGMDEELSVEIRQSMRQGVSGCNLDELRWLSQRMPHVRQALSQWDDTGLGVFLGPTQQGDLIDLLRPKEVFSRAGATNIALPANGRLQFPRQTGATTAHWINEVPSDKTTPGITQSEPTTGTLDLVAKKQAVFCKMPNDLLRFANPTVEAFIRNDITRVMALSADRSMLDGVASGHRVKGITNYAINKLTASTVGANGNVLEPRDLGRMLTAIEEADHDIESQGLAFVMRPALQEQILERRAHVYDGQSGTVELGPYLFHTNRADISSGRPMMLRGYPVIRSTQVANNRTKGGATNLSYILAGIFADWIIARVGVVEFATASSGDTAFATDQTWLRAIQHIDAGPRYESSFAMVDELLMDLA